LVSLNNLSRSVLQQLAISSHCKQLVLVEEAKKNELPLAIHTVKGDGGDKRCARSGLRNLDE